MKILLPLLTCTLLAGSAQAQTPAAEVQALTKRLNELLLNPAEPDAEVLVSLADCGVRQTVRKYRTAQKPNSTTISVSNTRQGSGWAFRTDDKVELEIKLGLAWDDIGAVSYQAKQDEKTQRRYYQLTFLRRPGNKGPSVSIDNLNLSLQTQDEKEVAELVRRLGAVRRQCSGDQG